MFTVAAVNAVGVSQAAEPLTLVAFQAPGVPTDVVRLSFDSPTQITIGWTAPSDDGGSPATIDYQVYSDQGLAAGYTQLSTTTSSLTSYTIAVTTSLTYYFKIKALNDVGSSVLSAASPGMLAGSVPS